ncbi:MAG: hypothetical protein ACP5P9_09555 [Acidimicrobiales bacterium]
MDSEPERVDLRHGQLPPGGHGQLNRHVAALAAAAVLFLIPWIAYLSISLPRRYDAHHWRLVWIGFDVFEILALAHVARSAWSRRRVTLVSALIVGTLLFSDAWFDVVTSLGNTDAWVSIATALGAELPLSFFFFWIARRILVRTVAVLHDAQGATGPRPRLRDSSLLAHSLRRQAAETLQMDLPDDDQSEDAG